jgi:hypothetical protein
LKLAGYDGPVSIEAKWESIETQAAEAFAHIERIVQDAGL